jgi:hypothetical protein
MGKDERRGARRNRNKLLKRTPDLGYYCIVTDGEETEINYLNGLKASIPEALRGRLVIKALTVPTNELLKRCLEMVSVEPQYRKPWIVFDRDRLANFDQIICEADNQGISVGWSNPCIEIWFLEYFGSSSTFQESIQCVTAFKKAFKTATGQEYHKDDKDIYKKLCKYGNEENAISSAVKKLKNHDTCKNPSEKLGATTLHQLIEEIRRTISNKAY